MNVRELKDALEGYPDEFEVVLSSDEEGNSFSPLSGLGIGLAQKFGYEYEFSSWVDYEDDEDGDEIPVDPPRERTLADSNAVALWP